MENNLQQAPYPETLAQLLEELKYKPGWAFSLEHDARGQGCQGLTLNIYITGPDSYSDNTIRVRHLMPVPPAAYNKQSWRRWLLEQILLVERHEACEFFTIAGKKPFAPHHLDGNDPYTIFEPGTDEQEAALRR